MNVANHCQNELDAVIAVPAVLALQFYNAVSGWRLTVKNLFQHLPRSSQPNLVKRPKMNKL